MRGRSVVYSCCWASPAQSFSGPNPAGLMTIFYCLKFETSPTWRASFLYLFLPGRGRLPHHWVWSPSLSLDMDPIENTASNSYSIFVCIFVVTEVCLPSHSLATEVPPPSTILVFSLYVTIYITTLSGHMGPSSDVFSIKLLHSIIILTID
jgi:hypothetical protein